jgi:methyl-accepting chemotaxis protein
MRKQYFINKKFQAGFILKFFIILIVGGVFSVAITMMTTQSTLTSSFNGSKLVIEKTSSAILPSVIITSIITILVVGIIVAVVTLFVSHKIAGPMFRLEEDLKEISQGNLQKHIKIRNGDQFGSVARNLNEMVVQFNDNLREVQEQLDHLAHKAAIENIPQDFRDDLNECRQMIDTKFKL